MLNHITMQGRLCEDPQLSSTGMGVDVASFTLAVDRDYLSPEGERETDFIRCVAWRQTAAHICRYFKKGQAMLLSGRLAVRSYTGKDGEKKTVSEVNVEKVYFMEKKEDGM